MPAHQLLYMLYVSQSSKSSIWYKTFRPLLLIYKSLRLDSRYLYNDVTYDRTHSVIP